MVVFQDNLLEFVESLDADEIKGKEFVFFNRAVDEGSLARQVKEIFVSKNVKRK